MNNGHLRLLSSELPEIGSIRPNDSIRVTFISTEIALCDAYGLPEAILGM